MLVKMRESKGFTLVELMVVVAVIGILSAIAVPFYQRSIQKSRLSSKIFPGVHAIETNLASYHSFHGTFPPQASFPAYTSEANMQCFDADLPGKTLVISIKAPAGQCTQLSLLNGATLRFEPRFDTTGITGWTVSGTLAVMMGFLGE